MAGSLMAAILLEKQLATPPPKNICLTREAAKEADFKVNMKTVADILEDLGHCPTAELVRSIREEDLSPQQKAAMNKWLMEMQHAKPKSVELTGPKGGAIQFTISDADDAV